MDTCDFNLLNASRGDAIHQQQKYLMQFGVKAEYKMKLAAI